MDWIEEKAIPIIGLYSILNVTFVWRFSSSSNLDEDDNVSEKLLEWLTAKSSVHVDDVGNEVQQQAINSWTQVREEWHNLYIGLFKHHHTSYSHREVINIDEPLSLLVK